MVLNRAGAGVARPSPRCARRAGGTRRLVADAPGRHRRDEDPAKAALRELDEETGIRSVEIIAESPDWYTYDLPVAAAAQAWGGRYRGQKQKWFAARFMGTDEVMLAQPGQARVRHLALGRIDELLALIVPFKRAVYAQVVRDFAPLAKPE